MTRRRAVEPIWLLRAVVEVVHHAQIQEHGGLPGLRDEAVLDAALARPRNKWAYGRPSFPQLVAAYGFAIARSHPFLDGNKRTAFLAMATFAERNGFAIAAADAEIVATLTALAEGALSEAELARWIGSKLAPRGPRRR